MSSIELIVSWEIPPPCLLLYKAEIVYSNDYRVRPTSVETMGFSSYSQPAIWIIPINIHSHWDGCGLLVWLSWIDQELLGPNFSFLFLFFFVFVVFVIFGFGGLKWLLLQLIRSQVCLGYIVVWSCDWCFVCELPCGWFSRSNKSFSWSVGMLRWRGWWALGLSRCLILRQRGLGSCI